MGGVLRDDYLLKRRGHQGRSGRTRASYRSDANGGKCNTTPTAAQRAGYELPAAVDCDPCAEALAGREEHTTPLTVIAHTRGLVDWRTPWSEHQRPNPLCSSQLQTTTRSVGREGDEPEVPRTRARDPVGEGPPLGGALPAKHRVTDHDRVSWGSLRWSGSK